MTLVQSDQQHIWHPFTQQLTANDPILITRGEGAYLFDEQNKTYLDLISSWWVNLHGHAHPKIAQAIYEQALKLEHVLFAGFTHEPSVKLAESLLSILPVELKKVFYSDNGSTSVEIALKIAYQYWQNQNEPQRKRFIVFDRGYHGDTFGAMSVGKSSGFYNVFKELLFDVVIAPFPATWQDDWDVAVKEQAALSWFTHYLAEHSQEIAAVIIEPLVQGAGGMRMCRPEFLVELQQLLQRHHILLIFDEVMTGFGRTGKLFACNQTSAVPDLICLSKGITGGFLPLAVTVCRDFIYEAFLGESFDRAFAHGHSYTANPLGCAAGLASLELLLNEQTQQQIAMIEKVHSEELQLLRLSAPIKHVRQCGTIAAFELQLASEYYSKTSRQLQQRCFEQGIVVRPIGNVIYLMPPYCISANDLQRAYAILAKELSRLPALIQV